MSDDNYSCHVIKPGENDLKILKILARKFTELRIKGLKQDPNAFVGTLEEELRIEYQEQLERIDQPLKYIIVLIKNNLENTTLPWYENDWVAIIILLGPINKEEYLFPFFKTHFGKVEILLNEKKVENTILDQSNFSNLKRFWQLEFLYVDINHRKKGLAKKLLENANKIAAQESQKIIKEKLSSIEIRVFVGRDNQSVIQLYNQLGYCFIEDFKCTRAEAIVAMRRGKELPENYNDLVRFSTRGGSILVKLVSL